MSQLTRTRSWSPEPRYEQYEDCDSPQFAFVKKEPTPTMVTRSQSKMRESTPILTPHTRSHKETTPVSTNYMVTRSQSKARESTPLSLPKKNNDLTPSSTSYMNTRSQSKIRELTPTNTSRFQNKAKECTPSPMTTRSQSKLRESTPPPLTATIPKIENEDLSEKFSNLNMIDRKIECDPCSIDFKHDIPLELKIHRPLLFLKAKKRNYQFSLDYYPLNQIPIDNIYEDLITITTTFCDGAHINWEFNVETNKAILDHCPQDDNEDSQFKIIEDEIYLQEPYTNIILFSEKTKLHFQITPSTRRYIYVQGNLKEVFDQIYFVYNNNSPHQKEIDTLPPYSHINAYKANNLANMITWNAFCGFKRIKGEWWLP